MKKSGRSGWTGRLVASLPCEQYTCSRIKNPMQNPTKTWHLMVNHDPQFHNATKNFHVKSKSTFTAPNFLLLLLI